MVLVLRQNWGFKFLLRQHQQQKVLVMATALRVSFCFVMHIFGAKFQEHCFNISRDIVYSIFYHLRGEKLNYKSVVKEISKPPFFWFLKSSGHQSLPCLFDSRFLQKLRTKPIFGMSRDHNRKRLKTRTEWIVFEI